MANVLRFTGGKRCIVCGDQIDPERVRGNPDILTCEAGCQVEKAPPAPKRDTLTISG